MALYKDLNMTAEELETSVSDATKHNADTVSHITAAERTKWNSKLDSTATAKAAILDGVGNNIAETYTPKSECMLHAAPMQDGNVEGAYMLFAEYTFPKAANYESTDLTFLIRNRGVNATAEDGILRVRLRYGKAAAKFQYAQIYWMYNSNIDPTKFVLCYNDVSGKVQLFLNASTAFAGYIMKVLDMGTSADIINFASWDLYSPTAGQTELPTETDGWTTVTSTGV